LEKGIEGLKKREKVCTKGRKFVSKGRVEQKRESCTSGSKSEQH
jgi:hypothetical protein